MPEQAASVVSEGHPQLAHLQQQPPQADTANSEQSALQQQWVRGGNQEAPRGLQPAAAASSTSKLQGLKNPVSQLPQQSQQQQQQQQPQPNHGRGHVSRLFGPGRTAAAAAQSRHQSLAANAAGSGYSPQQEPEQQRRQLQPNGASHAGAGKAGAHRQPPPTMARERDSTAALARAHAAASTTAPQLSVLSPSEAATVAAVTGARPMLRGHQNQSRRQAHFSAAAAGPINSAASARVSAGEPLARRLPPPAARPRQLEPGCAECRALRAAGLTQPLLLREERHGPAPFQQRAPLDRRASWRLRERMKTANVGLVVCLNVGTDPPDVVKTNPCARKECWIDLTATSRSKARESVGRALQEQYERLQPRARYKQCLDPTVVDVQKLCAGLRRSAKGDRVLLHYNGHGVPRPTSNGELWVFNKSYTQYIPLSVHDLKAWVGSPAVYVLDCSAAGILVPHFVQPSWSAAVGGSLGLEDTQQLPAQSPANGASSTSAAAAAILQQPQTAAAAAAAPAAMAGSAPTAAGGGDAAAAAPPSGRNIIVLAACRAHELLPMNPELPADVFTSCLTTPLQIALRWFISMNRLSMARVEPGWVDEIPGKVGDRKTPLGELNWVFTAITDTIAWNCLPSQLFQKLFRQDLLLASLFRNFLLADRILRGYSCTPVSHPRLPPTSMHPLWQSWDLAAESCLSRLHQARNPRVSRPLAAAGGPTAAAVTGASLGGDLRPGGAGGIGVSSGMGDSSRPVTAPGEAGGKTSRGSLVSGDQLTPDALAAKVATDDGFFREQLTAFEVWLEFGGQVGPGGGAMGAQKPPEELPVVLQVLLSQAHRLRALQLLRRSLNLGPWAVDLALSVGIFPYVLKLLGSPTPELRQVLVPTWARVLLFDPSCQVDLVKDGAHTYFINHMGWADVPPEQRVTAAYVLTAIMDGFPQGQAACLQNNLHATCVSLLDQAQAVQVAAAAAASATAARGQPAGGAAAAADVRGGGGGGGMAPNPNWASPRNGNSTVATGAAAATAMGRRLLPQPETPITGPPSPPTPRGKVPLPPGQQQQTTAIPAPALPRPQSPLAEAAALQRWLCLCLAKLCWCYPEAQAACLGAGVHLRILSCLADESVEVRCAAAYALAGIFSVAPGMGATAAANAAAATSGGASNGGNSSSGRTRAAAGVGGYGDSGDGGRSFTLMDEERRQVEVSLACQLAAAAGDASALVRREVVLALAMLVTSPRHWGSVVCVAHDLVTRRDRTDGAAMNAAADCGTGVSGVPPLGSVVLSFGREDGSGASPACSAFSGSAGSPGGGSFGAGCLLATVSESEATLGEENGHGAAAVSPPGPAADPPDPVKELGPELAAELNGLLRSPPGVAGVAGGSGGRSKVAEDATSASAAAAAAGEEVLLRLSAALGPLGPGYLRLWLTLRSLHRRDPFPAVAEAATAVISAVHEHVLELSRSFNGAVGAGGPDAGAGLPADNGAVLGPAGTRAFRLGSEGGPVGVHTAPAEQTFGSEGSGAFHRAFVSGSGGGGGSGSGATGASGSGGGAAGTVSGSAAAAAAAAAATAAVSGAAPPERVRSMMDLSAPVMSRYHSEEMHSQRDRAWALAAGAMAAGGPHATVAIASPAPPPPRLGLGHYFSTTDLSAVAGGWRGVSSGGGVLGAGGPLSRSVGAPAQAMAWLQRPHLLHAFYRWSCGQFSRLAAAGGDGADDAASPNGSGSGRSTSLSLAASTSMSSFGGLSETFGMMPVAQVQVHRHEPVDPFSYEGAEHLYFVQRNTRVRIEAEALAKYYRAKLAPEASATELYGLGGSADIVRERLALAAPPREKGAPRVLRLEQLLVLDAAAPTSVLCFHAYEPLLVVADDKDGLSCWDVHQGKRRCAISNGNGRGSRLTALQWINEASESLLLAGSDDGVIRVWDSLLESGYGPSADHADVDARANDRSSWDRHGGSSASSATGAAAIGSGARERDGGARFGWGHIEAEETRRARFRPRLVTAFRAVPDMVAGGRGPGLVARLSQNTGLLVCGGSSRCLRIWDVAREQLWAQWGTSGTATTRAVGGGPSAAADGGGAGAGYLPGATEDYFVAAWADHTAAGPGSRGGPPLEHCMTAVDVADAITSGPLASCPGLCVAGMGDGGIRLYDPRQGGRAVRRFEEHQNWIVRLEMTGNLTGHELLSGCAAGVVRSWDVRMSHSLSAISVQRGPMTALARHPNAPIIASGSHNQFIKVLTLDGETLSVVRYHDGFLGQRIGPVSALAFHPKQLVMAAGATDSIVSVYGAVE